MNIDIERQLQPASMIYRGIDTDKIPCIKFKPDWNVKVIPPFGGATMRFTVERGGKRVSVYCDHFGCLGFFCDSDGNEAPYWEMYPRTYREADGELYQDTMRFALQDADRLVKEIECELNGETA